MSVPISQPCLANPSIGEARLNYDTSVGKAAVPAVRNIITKINPSTKELLTKTGKRKILFPYILIL